MLTLYIADAERGVGMKNLSQKEAIALLRNLEDSLDSYCGLNEEGKTAFRMAIEALSCSDIPNNSDTISRQQAIDALRDYLVEKRCPDDGMLTCRLIENEVINKLPSVQPERKTGRWIEHENADIVDGYYVPKYECSCCHTWKHDDSDYCPDCGTKMCGADGGEQK